MSDNWTSFISLAAQGDWAKWSITLGSTEVDRLNGIGASPQTQVVLRYAVTASGDVNSTNFALIVNDFLMVLGAATFSPATWTSAGRFVPLDQSAFGSYAIVGLSGSVPQVQTDAGIAPYSTAGQPWKVGANTLRLVNFANVQIDVDFVSVIYGGTTLGGFQNVAETAPAGFTTHTNGTPLTSYSSAASEVWILKGSDATTGTAAVGVIDFDRLCPVGASGYRAVPHVHAGGLNAAGDVAGILVQDPSTITRATLNGVGRAVLDGYGGSHPITVWYGGSDAVGPELVSFPAWPLIWTGCGGWHVGSIGVR